MDAELFARAGANVTNSDLSAEAVERARVRAKRFEIAFESVIADAENLPYADGSVDGVAVHDGLHHLEDPFIGIAEMARVARHWVMITEPARAQLTSIAVRVRLARDKEESGNAVARLNPNEVAAYLAQRGFVIRRAERYAMYYPHRPGRIFRALSAPALFPAVRLCWAVANALLGRIGNKMVVVAERAATPAPGVEIMPVGFRG